MKSKIEYSLPYKVIKPEKWLRPQYRISPFSKEYIHANNKIISKSNIELGSISFDKYFNDNKPFSYITASGREAIGVLLEHLFLKSEDEVLIVNTSGSPYISGCVTKEVEKVCKWSRVLSDNTKCVIVIHEFGFPAVIPAEVYLKGVPIIEDCAYALGSQNENGTVGKMSDYAIYSFSKMFPVQYGGIIRSNKEITFNPSLQDQDKEYLVKLLCYYLEKMPIFLTRKRRNYSLFRKLFAQYGIKPRFAMKKENVPACFVFKLPYGPSSDKMKMELNDNGIESTVYYGGDGYYIPCHQNLQNEDIEYIFRNVCSAMGLNESNLNS